MATVTAPGDAAAATSAMPPDSGVAITGVPHASASSATFGKPSQRDRTSTASAPAKDGQGAESKPANRIRLAAPRKRAWSSTAARSDSSPKRHSRSSALLVANMSISRSNPFAWVRRPAATNRLPGPSPRQGGSARRRTLSTGIRQHGGSFSGHAELGGHLLCHRPVLTQHQVSGRVEQSIGEPHEHGSGHPPAPQAERWGTSLANYHPRSGRQ